MAEDKDCIDMSENITCEHSAVSGIANGLGSASDQDPQSDYNYAIPATNTANHMVTPGPSSGQDIIQYDSEPRYADTASFYDESYASRNQNGEPEQRSVEHSDDIYEGPSQSMGNFEPLASKGEAHSALSSHVLLIGIASFALVLLLGLTTYLMIWRGKVTQDISEMQEHIKLIQEGSGLVNLDEIQKQIAINQNATNEMVLSLNQSIEEQAHRLINYTDMQLYEFSRKISLFPLKNCSYCTEETPCSTDQLNNMRWQDQIDSMYCQYGFIKSQGWPQLPSGQFFQDWYIFNPGFSQLTVHIIDFDLAYHEICGIDALRVSAEPFCWNTTTGKYSYNIANRTMWQMSFRKSSNAAHRGFKVFFTYQ